jgi:putative ABC transport system ATP-binding protein
VTDASPAILTAALEKVYGEGDLAVRALAGVDLSIDRGSFVVLLGPSGSGKTTLLNVIGGIDTATSGSVVVDGIDLSSLDAAGRTLFRRDHVGFVFQFFNLIPTLTALENVQLIAEISGRDGGDSRTALEAVGLATRADNFPAGLSGGEQQRVAIARAVAKAPPLLLGDEPTGALDLETGRTVLALLRKMNRERGITMLLVTHSGVIAEMADRVLALRDGRIVDDRTNERPREAAELVW